MTFLHTCVWISVCKRLHYVWLYVCVVWANIRVCTTFISIVISHRFWGMCCKYKRLLNRTNFTVSIPCTKLTGEGGDILRASKCYYTQAPNLLKEGRKKMFYLTTHSAHFIYGYVVKGHSDSERGNPLPLHGLLFLISSKGSFICTISTDMIAHTTAFVTPVVEHWLEREIGPRWRIDPTTHRTMSENSYHGASLPNQLKTSLIAWRKTEWPVDFLVQSQPIQICRGHRPRVSYSDHVHSIETELKKTS